MISRVKRFLKRFNAWLVKNLMGTITHVKTSSPVIALTFDDGPDPIHTPCLLDILRKYNAKATFFLVGYSAAKHLKLLKRIAEEGHALGNHSWDHPSFPLISSRERRQQIYKCDGIINNLNNFNCKLFRPPYGDQNIRSRLDILLTGHKVITWKIVAMDWMDKNASFMADRIMDQIMPGSIILFHDSLFSYQDEILTNREETLKTVEIILNKLSGHYRFVTVPELLKYGKPNLVNWLQKPTIEYLKNLKSQGDRLQTYLS